MAKQVSKSKMDKIVKAYAGAVKTMAIQVGDEVVELEIKQDVPYVDYTSAIDDMVELSFVTDDAGHVEYSAEREAFARRYVFLKYFTNVDIDPKKRDGSRDPDFVSRIWGLYSALDNQPGDDDFEPYIMSSIEIAAHDIIRERRKALDVDAVRFWKTLNDFADGMQDHFGEMSEEDIRNASEAMAKLANISESDIVTALNK